MNTIITDDLVEKVENYIAQSLADAGAACFNPMRRPDASCTSATCVCAAARNAAARAALAIAVPEIVRACAEVAADYEPLVSGGTYHEGAATAADEIDSRIRALTQGEAS